MENDTQAAKSRSALGKRIVTALAILLIASLAIFQYITFQNTKNLLHDEFTARASIVTELMAADLGTATKFRRTDPLNQAFELIMARKGSEVEWTAVVDDTGQIIAELGVGAPTSEELQSLWEGAVGSEGLVVRDHLELGRDQVVDQD